MKISGAARLLLLLSLLSGLATLSGGPAGREAVWRGHSAAQRYANAPLRRACGRSPGALRTLRIRGGSEALHSHDFGTVEERLAELELLHKQGHLSEDEMLKERERLLLASAKRNVDLQKETEERDDGELGAENATIARRANNNMARMLADRPQQLEAADGSSSHGLARIDGTIGFSPREIAAWRRRAARLAAEEAAGMRPLCGGRVRARGSQVEAACRKRVQHGNNRLLPYWIRAAEALCRAQAQEQAVQEQGGADASTSAASSPQEGFGAPARSRPAEPAAAGAAPRRLESAQFVARR
jgi:hypothetical protein